MSTSASSSILLVLLACMADSGISTFSARATLSVFTHMLGWPPARATSTATASMSGIVCTPPVMTTASPGFTPAEVFTICLASFS